MKREGSAAIPGIPNFLGAAGNMAIQRAASGPLAGNPSAAAILGGANMSSGGCSCGGSGSCAECKKKPVQRKGEGDAAGISPGFHSAMNRSGGGAPLAPHTRSAMEQRFGENFDNVRVHSDGAAADASRAIRAHAFTTGRDIYFGQGRYEPHSVSGQKLLAHELTHVLQQSQGVVKPGLKSLTANAQNDEFEREAEQAEAHVDREEHGVHARIPAASHGVRTGTGGSHSVQRKCACGGTCSKCSGESNAPVATELNKTPIQRKCACGGTCASCSGKVEELKTPVVQGKAEASAEPQRERNPGAREKSPSQKQRQRDGLRREKLAGPQPGTGANGRGRRAVRSLAKSMPSILRSAATDSQAGSGTHNYKFEKEADHAANEVAHGRNVASEKLTALGGESIQPSGWEWCNPFTDPDCGVRSTAGVIKDEASDIAEEVWDEAKSLAKAVGGILTYINNFLTITIPPKHILNAHSFQTDLPELAMDLPFLAGIVPIAPGVEIYGEVGLHLGITPEIGLQLGPFDTHAITIAIHPLTLDGEVTGGFDLTIAGLLGGEARAGIFGEVGVIIEWPDPPFVLKAPAANIQAGLTGTLRGMLGDHMSVDFHGEAGISGFSFSLDQHHDLGFAVDLGLAGYGQLSVLGINICTLKWPLYEAHKDALLSMDLDFSVGSLIGGSGFVGGGGSSGGGGASGSWGGGGVPSISSGTPSASISPKNWDDLGIQFQRQVNKDDCPLCQFLHDLGLMPSQNGGTWTGHPAPPWPIGPRFVYPRDPHITSKSLCRGACGPNCDTCKHEKEHRECVPTPDGCHVWWVYPNYEICESHLGCRNHDACYDWCSTKGYGKGRYGIYLSPCHRLCDFECLCDYNLPQCVGWIGGKPPYDGEMIFSDLPHMEPGCTGPCPKEGKTPGAPLRLCLPDITIIDRKGFHKAFRHATDDIAIFSTPLEIPYIPPVILDVFVRGEVRASVDAGVGPVTLEGLCLLFDPTTFSYKGTGSVHLKGDVGGMLNLTGIVGAKAGWGCLLNAIDLELIRGEAGLSATGLAHIPLDLSATATVSCRHGKLMLDIDALFKACLDLRFKLDALLRVLLFKRFEIFNGKWNLIDRRLGRCWDIPIDITKGEIGSAACGGKTAAAALGLPAPSGPPAGLATPGPSALPSPLSAGAGLSHAEMGKVDTLSIKDIIADLFKLATQDEVVHDKKHGGVPADPAKDVGKENPCGNVKPDDECGSKKLPLTHVSFSPGPLGQGGRIKASPLTKCAGNTEGSEPDSHIYEAQFDCIANSCKPIVPSADCNANDWLRGHILHGKTSKSGPRNLHGPGDDIRNLIIIDQSLNQKMRSGVEGEILTRVHNKNEVLWYESTVDSYVAGLDFFAESISIKFGLFNTDTGTEGPVIDNRGPFVLKRRPPNCPAGAGGLVVPPGVLGGAADECADPLNIPDFDVTLDSRKRTVKMRDAKHTRMAKKTMHRILQVASQSPNCSDSALSACEQDFCKAVDKTDKKKFGGQIDSATRVGDVYKQLLVDAWQGKKPPAGGEWTEFGSAADDVGFDMDSKAATTAYTVHTNVTTGGKLLTATHLFPGEGD
jgi:hypothetical protein